LAPNDPSLNPAYLKWKYYERGPAWEGSRSYALSNGGKFLAHAAIWPVQLRIGSYVRNGIGFGDWAADKEQRGIGLLLLKHLMSLTSFVMATGGRDITRGILRRVGFQEWSQRAVYARVLRPLRQAVTRGPTLNWKEPARLSRNFLWSRAPLVSVGDWTAETARPDDQVLALALKQAGSAYNADFVEYMLRCPTAAFQYLVLRKAGEPCGFAIWCDVLGQARLADVRIASGAQRDWDAVIALMLAVFKRNPTVCEAMAFGSNTFVDQALLANGFRLRDRRPLVIFDPEGQITTEPVPVLGLLEDDASFLRDPQHPFFT
jgi:hypothetical protein